MNRTNTPTTTPHRLRFRDLRISNKLLIVMLIVSLIPLIAVALIITQNSARALTEQTHARLTQISASLAGQVAGAIDGGRGVVGMAASEPELIALLRDETQREGDVQATLGQIVSAVQVAQPAVDVVGIYDQTGTALAHTDPALVGRNLSVRDFVSAALTGKAFTSAYRLDAVNGAPGIHLATPILDGTDVIGAVAMHLDESAIQAVLDGILGMNAPNLTPEQLAAINLMVVDPNGIVMVESGNYGWSHRLLGALSPTVRTQIEETFPLGGVCPDGAATCPLPEKAAVIPLPIPSAQPLADALRQSLAGGTSGHVRLCRTTSPDAPADSAACAGAWSVMAFAPVRLPDRLLPTNNPSKNLFMIVAELPEAGFLASVRTQRLQSLLVAVLISAVVVVGSIVVARSLTNPISLLSATAREITNDSPFEPGQIADIAAQRDEVGFLARVFSSMVMALRARMAELKTIHQVSYDINVSIELDDTVNYVLDAIADVIPCSAAELCLLDKKQNVMTLVTARGKSAAMDAEITYSVDHPLIRPLLTSQRGVILEAKDAGTEVLLAKDRTWSDPQPHSYLGAPLLVKNEVIGVIELVSDQPAAFDTNHLRVLESIAAQAALAIQHAQEVQIRERHLKEQIRELHIEIDEIRREKQVGEIVDTDYFRRLSEQASRLRSARNSGVEPTEQ